MTTASNWPDWPIPDDETLEQARDAALAACVWAATHNERPAAIVRYYSDARYAGNLFSTIEPNRPDDVEASDVLATTTLSVKVTTTATRRLLLPGPARTHVLDALADVPTGAKIDDATAKDWLAAETFYLAARDALGRRPWVTASKLVARKRPDLLPVRDNVVVGLLRPGQDAAYQQDWFTIRHLMLDQEVRQALAGLREIADAVGPDRSESSDLRLLDVALWMYGLRG